MDPTITPEENDRRFRECLQLIHNVTHEQLMAVMAYGSIGLEQPEGSVIPYSDLTPELVIGWVQEKLGGAEKVAEIQAALQAQIDQQRTPTTATGLPWQ